MQQDWESKVAAAASAATTEANEAEVRAAVEAETKQALQARAQAVCAEHFVRARDFLVAKGVPMNSRYAVGYKKGLRGVVTGNLSPVHLDGWQFTLFGVQNIWICEDGRSWRADHKHTSGQSRPRFPNFGKTGFGPTGDRSMPGPDPINDDPYIPFFIEFDEVSGELLDGQSDRKQPFGDVLAEAVGKFVAATGPADGSADNQ